MLSAIKHALFPDRDLMRSTPPLADQNRARPAPLGRAEPASRLLRQEAARARRKTAQRVLLHLVGNGANHQRPRGSGRRPRPEIFGPQLGQMIAAGPLKSLLTPR